MATSLTLCASFLVVRPPPTTQPPQHTPRALPVIQLPLPTLTAGGNDDDDDDADDDEEADAAEHESNSLYKYDHAYKMNKKLGYPQRKRAADMTLLYGAKAISI